MKDHLIYKQDGNRFEWHWKSTETETGWYSFYFTTDDNGNGVFRVDLEANDRRQLVGTCDFSLSGLKDPRAKIRRFMAAD